MRRTRMRERAPLKVLAAFPHANETLRLMGYDLIALGLLALPLPFVYALLHPCQLAHAMPLCPW